QGFELRDWRARALEQGQTAVALVLVWEIFGAANGFFKGDPGKVRLAHHVGGHADVKLNFRVIGGFLSALLENGERLLIIAAFIENPAKSIADGSVLPLQLTGFTGQLVSFVEVVQVLGVKISEIV